MKLSEVTSQTLNYIAYDYTLFLLAFVRIEAVLRKSNGSFIWPFCSTICRGGGVVIRAFSSLS